MCCGDSGGDWNGGRACGPCRLEGIKSGNSYNLQGGNVKLEGPGNLVVLFRRQMLTATELERATINSIRLKLFKVAARVQRSCRRLCFHFASGWPQQASSSG